MKPKNLLVVGAGFSANAGLPLANEFTERLLSTAKNGPSRRQVRYIKHFVEQAFGRDKASSVSEWPELEDIFTTVDLSANTGHHLGTDFSASELRVVRRAIIVRMIRMLGQRYEERRKAPDAAWRKLEEFFRGFDVNNSAVLSMNWDTVFERRMHDTQSIDAVDYGCDAHGAKFKRGDTLEHYSPKSAQKLHLLKPHGSVNWLYCDACRETMWVPPGQQNEVAKTLFRQRDWDVISKVRSTDPDPQVMEPRCLFCGGRTLGTRFATFSYRKALDFPMYAASWRTAERYLKEADNWIFAGYSMPSADFEFKYLLKRVQLSKTVRPSITVITGGSKPAALDTIARYDRFFGLDAGRRHNFQNALDDAALDHLRALGMLTAS